ncbi:MAG: hypothetical protein K8S27_01340 [Candidatus Omnitrophica bacterium]|nr:hypothetical protein [Candidatus Omnitrophota bacterium]
MLIKKILFFFASLTLAVLVSVYLHEMGHVFGLKLATGQTATVTFNPLHGAVTTYANQSMTQAQARLVTGGGILFGALFGIVLGLAAWGLGRSLWSAPFLLVGVLSSGLNGLMLVIGTAINQSNDIGRLLSLGISPVLMFVFGLILLLICLGLFLMVLPALGITARTPLGERCLVLFSGVAPYLVSVMVYNYFKHPQKMVLYSLYCFFSVVSTFFAILLSQALQHCVQSPADGLRSELAWTHVIYAHGLMVLSICYVLFAV